MKTEKTENIYRIQIKFGKTWKTGINDYTKEQAELAKARMISKGVQCRVVKFFE